MKVIEIQKLLEADIVCGEADMELNTEYVFGTDMMSDVLAFAEDCATLITGLCNPQVVRTAEMLDINCIVFVCGKQPTENIITLAEMKDMAILTTKHSMFTSCGILYTNGLRTSGRCF
ncbi:MAG: DRTGG domain-containing protein [Schaedlerella sp.]|nr:DRTGG domain-containing protein [Schaedlerella sp.]